MSYRWRKVTSRANKINQPLGAIVSQVIRHPLTSGLVPMTTIQSYESSIVNANVTSGNIFINTAVVGLEGIFRPFAINTNAPTYYNINGYSNFNLSYFNTPVTLSSGYSTPVIVTPPPTNTTLNPYQSGCDLEWIMHGIPNCSGFHVRKNPLMNWDTARGIALKTPFVATGWGYSVYGGYPVPNASGDITTTSNPANTFASGYLSNSSSWKTGTVDLRWDEIRKVYCTPGMVLMGTLDEVLNTGTLGASSGALLTLKIWDENFAEKSLGYHVRVFNYFGASLTAGTKCYCGYNPLLNKFLVISADCVST